MLNQMIKHNRFALVSLVAVFLLISTVFAAVLLLQRQGDDTSFDTRRAAMVDSGLAELDTYPFNQSTLKVKEQQKINLQLNTKAREIKQIELIFEIIADKGLLDKSKIQFTDIAPEVFEVNKQEIVESICAKDCFTATLVLSLKDEDAPFITADEMQSIAQLAFTPQKEGSLRLKIVTDSVTIEQETNADILQKPSVLEFQYYVTDNGIDRAQCYFEYSDWSECKNGWQTRQYSVEPDKCFWYKEEVLQELSRTCTDSKTVKVDSRYFYLDVKTACLNQPNEGRDIFLLWHKNHYKNIDWIDVSSSPTFGDFYHKKVEGNIDQTVGDYLAMRADGFSHATGNKAPLSFEPNREYFFRLHTTDNGGQHISAVRLYLTYCSGDQSAYKNCNDRCDESSDQSKVCAPGMTCHEGLCRNTSNPYNTSCLATPGISSNDRSCNQYCANSNDCAAGLTCFWNHCRLPSNLESTSCAQPVAAAKAVTRSTAPATTTKGTTSRGGTLLPSEAYDLATSGCNQGCNNNRDCDADMRCYKGSCRLAADPEDKMCALGSQASQDTEAATPSATVAPASPSPTADRSDRTLGDDINQFFVNILSNFPWQWLAVAGGLLIAALTLIVAGISRSRRELYPRVYPRVKTLLEQKESEDLQVPPAKPTQI